MTMRDEQEIMRKLSEEKSALEYCQKKGLDNAARDHEARIQTLAWVLDYQTGSL